MNEKVCPSCGEEKSRDQYYLDRAKKDNMGTYCKRCTKKKTDKWYWENHERALEQRRKYHAENRDRLNRYSSEYYQENKDHFDKYRKEWAKENPEKDKRYKRKWARENRGKCNARLQRRRARIAGNGGSFTDKEWRDLVIRTGNKCLCCGEEGDHTTLTRDHIKPVSKGGTSFIRNIQPLCMSCNASKGDSEVDYR